MRRIIRISFLWLLTLAAPAGANESAAFRDDARLIEALINDNYAYLERLPGGRLVLPAELREETKRVNDRHSLLRYAERVLLALADHHAITPPSFADSWAGKEIRKWHNRNLASISGMAAIGSFPDSVDRGQRA